jgi:hypothetical protein
LRRCPCTSAEAAPSAIDAATCDFTCRSWLLRP